MRVFSTKALNVEGCVGKPVDVPGVVHTPNDVHHVLQFGCGLILSSRFWTRLSIPLREDAVARHLLHHVEIGHRADGEWCLLGLSLGGKDWIKDLVCGGQCDFSPLIISKRYLVYQRSDVIRDELYGGETLSFTMGGLIFCSCSGLLTPSFCIHRRLLAPLTRKLIF